VLYHRYAKPMLYFFYQRLYQDEQKAQDLLQDLFLKIVERPEQFNRDKKFKTWLYTIAANMCKNEYRKDAVRGVKINYVHLNDMPEIETVFLPDRFDKALFAATLTTELNKLNESQRDVFLLRYQEECSINEISEILGCAEGTVRSRLFYCIKKLAVSLRAFNPQNELE